jgi:methionine-rich copper-binding protein CopC
MQTRLLRRLAPLAAIALIVGGLVALAGTASAHPRTSNQTLQALHAKFSSSDPAPNAVLKTAPSVVTIHFEENVNPTGSAVTVYDSKWKVVSTGPATVDRTDTKTMHVNMAGDGSEVYVVVWNTVSLDDGDPYAGAFTFTVSATASSSSGATTTSQATDSSGGISPWLGVLFGVIGLVVGGAGGLWFARRQAGVK